MEGGGIHSAQPVLRFYTSDNSSLASTRGTIWRPKSIVFIGYFELESLGKCKVELKSLSETQALAIMAIMGGLDEVKLAMGDVRSKGPPKAGNSARMN